jgi:hypothetical protein
MPPAGFLRQQWPKRHPDYQIIERCVAIGRALHVADVRPALTAADRRVVRTARRSGQQWLVCPGCGRLRDALYCPAGVERRGEWACRVCHRLIYACQRWGPRGVAIRELGGALRPTPRMQRGRLRAGSLQHRRAAERQDRLARAMRMPRQGDVKEEPMRKPGGELEAMIAAEAERSLARLRELAETAPSNRLRAKAWRKLERYGGALPSDACLGFEAE